MKHITANEYFTFPINERVYDAVPFGNCEGLTIGNMIEKLVERLDAKLGKEEGEFILEHQDQIPDKLRGSNLLFANWRCGPGYPEHTVFIYWCRASNRWSRDAIYIKGGYWPNFLLMRRTKMC